MDPQLQERHGVCSASPWPSKLHFLLVPHPRKEGDRSVLLRGHQLDIASSLENNIPAGSGEGGETGRGPLPEDSWEDRGS